MSQSVPLTFDDVYPINRVFSHESLGGHADVKGDAFVF